MRDAGLHGTACFPCYSEVVKQVVGCLNAGRVSGSEFLRLPGVRLTRDLSRNPANNPIAGRYAHTWSTNGMLMALPENHLG
jgi:hypothetical protein